MTHLLFSRDGPYFAEFQPWRLSSLANTLPRYVIPSIAGQAMKTGEWPPMWTSRVAVLDRIVMNVIAYPREVGVVANGMFPESPLPDAPLLRAPTRRTAAGLLAALAKESVSEATLQEAHARREIRVAVRENPDGMPVIGQQYARIDLERPIDLRSDDRFSKNTPRLTGCEKGATEIGDDRQEKGSARDKRPLIARHEGKMVSLGAGHEQGVAERLLCT